MAIGKTVFCQLRFLLNYLVVLLFKYSAHCTCMAPKTTVAKEIVRKILNSNPIPSIVTTHPITHTTGGTPLIISCEKCNSAVLLDTPDDIAYLYRLAQENPLLYAELACKPNGLQEYVDAMNEFN